MSSATAERPIDFAHLARYTGGDAKLDAEVLRLFAGQAELIVRSLETCLAAGDTKGWFEAAHTLKGAARGVGAFGLADAAAALEAVEPHAAAGAAALHRLKNKSQAVCLFIEAHLAA